MKTSTHLAQRATIAVYLLLILLILAWEGWLAPAANAPPGLWLTLKSLPLLLPLRGLLRGNVRTYLLSTLLLLFYFTDGVVLTYLHWQEGFGIHKVLPYALAEWLLAISCFSLALISIKQGAARSPSEVAEG